VLEEVAISMVALAELELGEQAVEDVRWLG
jgi:hypothetical protein